MITKNSRYLDGLIVVQPDETVAVRRLHLTPTSNIQIYTWKQTDRLDRIAARFLGRADYWWQIMDVNPLIQDPHDIGPGEQIRIPTRV